MSYLMIKVFYNTLMASLVLNTGPRRANHSTTQELHSFIVILFHLECGQIKYDKKISYIFITLEQQERTEV